MGIENKKTEKSTFNMTKNKSKKMNKLYKETVKVMIQNSPVSMCILEDLIFINVNNHFCNLTGYSQEELVFKNILTDKLLYPDDLSIFQENITRKMEEQEPDATCRVRILKKDGTLMHVEIYTKEALMDGKEVSLVTVLNVTEEVKTSLKLKENKERFQSLFDNNPDAVFTFDLDGNFTDANAESANLTGYTTGELFELSFVPLIVTEDLATALHYFQEAVKGNTNQYEIMINRKDGKRRALEVTCFPMNFEGNIVGAYGIAKDVTDRNKQRKLLEDLVFYDPLTRLPNRKLFEDRLSQVFKLSAARKNQPAVLFLDFNRLHFINASLGHHIGDEFLKAVAERLLQNVRDTDTVARFGGNEFAILQPSSNKQEAIILAERLNQVLEEPFQVMEHSLTVSVSIGIAFSNVIENSVEDLIKKADTAMYYTKKHGRNNYTIYTEELDQKTAYKLTLEQDLKSAIKNQEFVLYYQPIIDLKTGFPTAMEALIRWNHPELGLVPPDHFIPISEESGQIVSIGKWVLHTACAQNKDWQDKGFGPFKMCVNISTIQLQQSDFVQSVRTTLEETGLDGKWLELEVTESILLEDTHLLKSNLTDLRALGLSLAIDDFGTGYTSLSYLRQFSFDRVKIDRCFVHDINNNLNGKAITSTIISLAHQLNMEVVAEGIEDETQLGFLQEQKADSGQGFYFSRPLPAELQNFSSPPKTVFKITDE